MSKLRTWIYPGARTPESVYEIEEENFAWIDFFWSMMGRQGEAGKGVDHIYKALHDPASLDKIVENLAKSIAAETDVPLVPEKMESWAIGALLRRIAEEGAKCERDHAVASDTGLSKDGEDGLKWYVERPLKEQIMAEGGQLMPLRMALVWGHTHKPFAVRKDFSGYPHGVEVFNTGGWVIETPENEPIRGGAVVVVNSEQEVASIEMFRDVKDGGAVKVCGPDVTREAHLAFRKELEDAIAADPQPWTTFSAAVAKAVAVRHAVLSKKG